MLITIDRKEAFFLLQQVCPNDRPVNLQAIIKYTGKMVDGVWDSVDVEESAIQVMGGYLTNGKHRLISFLMSGDAKITLPIEIKF